MSDLRSNLVNKSACLTFGGKKCKQELTDDSGDVDLLERDENLKLRKEKLEEDFSKLSSLQNQTGETIIYSLPVSYKEIMKTFSTIGQYIPSGRCLKQKYCKLMIKLIEWGDDQDLRKS